MVNPFEKLKGLMVQLWRKVPLAYIFKSHVNFIAQEVDTRPMKGILPLGVIF